jgi:hypothetical protein
MRYLMRAFGEGEELGAMKRLFELKFSENEGKVGYTVTSCAMGGAYGQHQ